MENLKEKLENDLITSRAWAKYEKNNGVKVPASVRVLAEIALALNIENPEEPCK